MKKGRRNYNRRRKAKPEQMLLFEEDKKKPKKKPADGKTGRIARPPREQFEWRVVSIGVTEASCWQVQVRSHEGKVATAADDDLARAVVRASAEAKIQATISARAALEAALSFIAEREAEIKKAQELLERQRARMAGVHGP